MSTFSGSDPRKCSRARSAFATLFAVALLVHQLWWHGFELDSPRTLVVAAATWLLLSPGSVGRFALLLAVQAGVLIVDLPFVMSHLMVVLIAAVTTLLALAVAALRRRDPWRDVAGFLRWTLLITYVVAGLAKLNTGFLDPAVSCAGPMITDLGGPLLSDPRLVAHAAAGTAVVELALPLLLAIPRARVAGLVLGGGFHLVLAAAGNVPFTALAFAFYVLFLPPDATRRLAGWVPERARWAALLVVPLWLGGATYGSAPMVGILTGAVVLVVAALGVAALLLGEGTPEPAALRVGSPILVAGLVVLLLNGASPYLGFKTESSLEMFSNLRTEPGAWNHVLVPEGVRIGDAQQPLRVVEGPDDLVARSAGPDLLVRGEVERVLRATPGATAAVEDAVGARSVLGPFEGGPTLADRVAWFRAAGPLDVPRC